MTLEEVYEELNISTILIPKGFANRPAGANTREYITIHETDNTDKGADADAHAKYLVGADARKRRVSWHFTVDEDEVIKHLPARETAWHTGSKEGNASYFGIEMGVNGSSLKSETLRRAALLTALLCKVEGVSIEKVVQHNHWSGKDCPSLLREAKGWTAFKKQVAAHLVSFDW